MAADRLESLVDSGEYQQAYELALPQLEQNAGEPGFDFLFGMAAIESGYPQQALFAFERVLAVEPQNQRARLELARANFMVGNVDEAKRLFDAVLATNPPQHVRENIQRFLDQINVRGQQRDHQFNASVDFKGGLDSNVNSATQVQSISLPIGLVLGLGDTSRALADEFYELGVSGSYLKLLRKDMGLFTALTLSDHRNASYHQFDLLSTGLSLGYIYKSGKHTLRIPLQWQQLSVGHAMYRNSGGVGAEWGFDFAKQQQLTLFGQWAQLRYKDSEQYRDADLSLAGGAWSYSFVPGGATLSLSAYLADETTTDSTYNYLGRNYVGNRLALQWQPKVSHELLLSWSQQNIHPVFGKRREESYSQLALEWNWHFVPHWSAGLTLNHFNNSSNIEIYSYDRTQEYATLGYSF